MLTWCDTLTFGIMMKEDVGYDTVSTFPLEAEVPQEQASIRLSLITTLHCVWCNLTTVRKFHCTLSGSRIK